MSIRETKKQKTKQAILEAAISLCSRNGYKNTSIDQIAKAAGIGKGTVYGYFHTKKDIIKAFCDYELVQIHMKLVNCSNHDAPILEQLLVIYMTEFKHVTQNKEFGRIFMREMLFPDDNNVQDNQEMDDKYFQILFPVLEKAQDRGELRKNFELLHITAHFYGIYILVMSAWYTGRIPTREVETTMKLLFAQLLEGLQAKNGPPTKSEKNNG